jgi:hypothetical protein
MQLQTICQEISGKMARKSYDRQRIHFGFSGHLTEGTTCINGVLWWLMRFLPICFVLLFSPMFAVAQSSTPATDDYSGMYSFLRDGEFIQISIEDQGKVSGFISRYGDSDKDKDTFLDQFFESGKLDSNHLSFKTKEVHGSWFTFEGTIERGTGKTLDDEGYYVIRGTLARFETNSEKKTTQNSQAVEFKSFPRDAAQ